MSTEAKQAFINTLVDNERKLAEAIIAETPAEEITETLGFDAAQIEKMTKRLASYDAGEAAAPREEEAKNDAPASEASADEGTGAAPVEEGGASTTSEEASSDAAGESADTSAGEEAAEESGDSEAAGSSEGAPVEQSDTTSEGAAPAAEESTEEAKPEAGAAA